MNERGRIEQVLMKVSEDYQVRGVVGFTFLEFMGHDVHAFYKLRPPHHEKLVHVQGYPGMSNNEQMRVYARLMDYDSWARMRVLDRCSPGNEHDAVTQGFENFGCGVFISYDALALEKLLEENVPELKGRNQNGI